MLTAEFRTTVQRLLEVAREEMTAVMCAERFYWRCHRRLLSDYLSAQGAEVVHIEGLANAYPHTLARGAIITPAGAVIYALADIAQLDFGQLKSARG